MAIKTKTQIKLEAEIKKSKKCKMCIQLNEDFGTDCPEHMKVKAKLQQHLEDIKQFEKLIDDEKKIVKIICLGLSHPSQEKQREFTKWLQDTVNFHVNQLKSKLKEL